jgi:uncharacterized cupin superfamily protein
MTATKTASKETLLEALRLFIAQRSGIDRRNYQSDWRDTAGAARWRVESVEFLAAIPGGFHFAGDDESRAACREIAAAIEELDRRN